MAVLSGIDTRTVHAKAFINTQALGKQWRALEKWVGLQG